MQTWRDTTVHVLGYFDRMKTALTKAPPQARGDTEGRWWQAVINGYVETLAKLGGRTGILTARRVGDSDRTVVALPGCA